MKILCSLSWMKNKKQPDASETKESSKLHDYLSSEHFVCTITSKLLKIAVFTKLVLIPVCYLLTNRTANRLFGVLASGLYPMNLFFVYPVVYQRSRRYKRKEYVQEEFHWTLLFKDINAYLIFYEFLVHIVFPIVIWSTGMVSVHHLIFGVILLTMDICALYGFYHFDFLSFIKHRNDMILYDSYELNYEPKVLSILEATPTYISMKNLSKQPLKPDFQITRRIEEKTTVRSQSGQVGEGTATLFFMQFQICGDVLIKPGSTFKIATTEFKGILKGGEPVIQVMTIRSFGPQKGPTVKISVKFKSADGRKNTVEMVQKYQRKRQSWEEERDLRRVYRRQFPTTSADSNV